MTTYSSRVYHEQGGDRLVVANGGEIMHEGHAAVTQLTDINTAVTANALSGTITTVSQTIAAGAEADFVVNNSRVAATDIVVACIRSTASAGTFIVAVAAVAAGQFTLRLTNLHASAAGNNTILISFFVVKARA